MTYRNTSIALAVMAGLSATATLAQDKSITVVSWGGAYTNSQIEAYHKPYMAETDVKINSEDYNGGLAEIRAQVESGNVVWDLVDAELSDVIRACDEGLIEPIDASILPAGANGKPASEDFVEGTLHECGVSTIIWSTIYAYDKDKFQDGGPTTMADFFNTEQFPGKRGLRKNVKPNLEMALIADGVPADEVYDLLSTPEGVDRAFAKLDTIRDDIIWWEAGAQPPQMLADGEVALTTAYNGRIFNAQVKEDKNFEIVWDGQVWDLDLWMIPKGAPNKEEALKFVAYSTGTQRLADQAKYISYAPARLSSIPMVATYDGTDIDMKPHMPTAPENFKNALQNDHNWWADNQDELNERFAAWLAQ